LRLTDKGYFGSGIYSTLQAEYAMMYAESKHQTTIDGESTLILCWVALGNVYPISRDTDYEGVSHKSKFYHELNGFALKPGFDSHCACVDQDSGYQATKDLNQKILYDEIVVKESSQVLPRCIIYYKIDK